MKKLVLDILNELNRMGCQLNLMYSSPMETAILMASIWKAGILISDFTPVLNRVFQMEVNERVVRDEI